jgi:hypothetical protein
MARQQESPFGGRQGEESGAATCEMLSRVTVTPDVRAAMNDDIPKAALARLEAESGIHTKLRGRPSTDADRSRTTRSTRRFFVATKRIPERCNSYLESNMTLGASFRIFCTRMVEEVREGAPSYLGTPSGMIYKYSPTPNQPSRGDISVLGRTNGSSSSSPASPQNSPGSNQSR